MRKRDFLKAGAMTAAAAVTAAAATAARAQGAQSYNWKMATGWPGGPLMDIGAKAYAQRMEQFTERPDQDPDLSRAARSAMR